jgi:hypothetical protein
MAEIWKINEQQAKGAGDRPITRKKTMKIPTPEELKKSSKFELHHTALTRRYISRKTDGFVTPYQGKFGKGYTLEHPNWDSNRYSFISYYIQK